MDPAEDNKYKFIYIRNTSFSLRFIGLFVVLAMFAAVPLVVLMINKQTTNKSHAAPSTTILLTSAVKAVPVGNKVPVAVEIDPGNNLVSLVKLTLSYDKTKLGTSSGFSINKLAFPTILNTPTTTCTTTICQISLTVSIGSNPTKVIQTHTVLGTIEFVTLLPTNQTQVTVDPATQVFSTDNNSQTNQNVLATTNPLNLTITSVCDGNNDNDDIGCPGTTPKPTCMQRPPCLNATPRCAIPEPAAGWCPITPTPMQCGNVGGKILACPPYYLCSQVGICIPPSPTPICDNDADDSKKCPVITPSVTVSPSVTATVTPTIATGETFASIMLMSPAIGIQAGNARPLHPTRSITVTLYNTATKQTYTAVDTVTFDGLNSFKNAHVNLGIIPSGTYQILVAMPGHLTKTLTQIDNTNTFTLQSGNTVIIPVARLIAGDIAPIPGKDNMPYGDNLVDIGDYNMLINCYGPGKQCSDVGKMAADLNDDGVVDAVDYNILLRSFATREGDTTPLSNTITPSPTPTAPPQTTLTPTATTSATVTP